MHDKGILTSEQTVLSVPKNQIEIYGLYPPPPHSYLFNCCLMTFLDKRKAFWNLRFESKKVTEETEDLLPSLSARSNIWSSIFNSFFVGSDWWFDTLLFYMKTETFLLLYVCLVYVCVYVVKMKVLSSIPYSFLSLKLWADGQWRPKWDIRHTVRMSHFHIFSIFLTAESENISFKYFR